MKTTDTMQLVMTSAERPDILTSVATCHIVAADHPCLDRDVDAFIARFSDEHPRVPSLIRALSERGGFRFAAIERGRVVGLVRVDPRSEMHIAVAADRRGLGIGTRLGTTALQQAISLEYSRVSMRTSRRSRAARRVGEAVGCIIVENARGRTDMIALLPTDLRSA